MSDLTDLFAKDPLTYTDQDLRSVIEEMRKKRHQFNAGNLKGGSMKPLTEKQKATAAAVGDVELDL